MLPVGIVAERLRASPFVRREMRKLRKEFARFLVGLGHSPEFSQGCGQGPSRDGGTCYLVAQRFDGILISACSILNPSKPPIIACRRMRVEAKGVARTFDAPGGPALAHPESRNHEPADGGRTSRV